MESKIEKMIPITFPTISSGICKKHGSLLAIDFGACKPKIYIPSKMLPVYEFKIEDYVSALFNKLLKILDGKTNNSLSVVSFKPLFESSGDWVTPDEVVSELFDNPENFKRGFYAPDRWTFLSNIIENFDEILYICAGKEFYHESYLKDIYFVYKDELRWVRNKDKYNYCILDLGLDSHTFIFPKKDIPNIFKKVDDYISSIEESTKKHSCSEKDSTKRVIYLGETSFMDTVYNLKSFKMKYIRLYIYPDKTIPNTYPPIPERRKL